MLEMIQPTMDELSFKQELLSDEDTMSFNHKYGGTIDFNQDRWQTWYDKWIGSKNPHYFYRYLCDIIIHSKYRNKGFGTFGLKRLCECAKKNGISELQDDILLDNPSVSLF